MRTNAANRCRSCEKPLGGATATCAGSHPKEGDFSVCGYCGDVTVFRADLTLRAPSSNERQQFVDAARALFEGA